MMIDPAELIVCTRCTTSVQHQFKITDSRQDSELHRGAWYTIQYAFLITARVIKDTRVAGSSWLSAAIENRKYLLQKQYCAVGICAPGCLESNNRYDWQAYSIVSGGNRSQTNDIVHLIVVGSM
jgi:hypothetical protein